MIFSGLTLAGTAVVLTVMMPVFVVLTPILVPAVITLSFLATGFLASGSLGASAITILVWLYKKEEHSKYTLHVREVQHERTNKLPEGEKPVAEVKPPQKNKLAEKLEKPAEEDKPPERNKLAEESYKPPGNDMVAVTEEDKPRERDKSPERDKQAEEDKPAEELTSIPEVTNPFY
ncbi:unnamed protein product [Arabis nemorensis]|uniref:Oleosin n=1 Tax=Arabis nemorensis TaxID=586526 RepID=A0A565CJ17_9BRAS|nr:unnamed protein product [Arabis nemorensis]